MLSKNETIDQIKRVVRDGPHLKLSQGETIADVELPWELAEGILQHLNTKNIRRLDYPRAEVMGRDMSSGDWTRSYDTIRFTKDFILQNGQTRLRGQLVSKTVQRWLIILDAPETSRHGDDKGTKRPITVSHGVPGYAGPIASVALMLLNARNRHSDSERATWYFQHNEAVTFYRRVLGTRPILARGAVIAAFVLVDELAEHRDHARELAEDLGIGSQEFPVSKAIARTIQSWDKAQGSSVIADRAIMILRGIQVHIQGGETANLSQLHPEALRWFHKEARYRLRDSRSSRKVGAAA